MNETELRRQELIHNAAAAINASHPRRIWVEGDGRVYRDGPGNDQRIEMTSLDLIKLIYTAQVASEKILSAYRLSGGTGEIKSRKSKWDVLAGCHPRLVRFCF